MIHSLDSQTAEKGVEHWRAYLRLAAPTEDKERVVQAWTALAQGYGHAGRENEALDTYEEALGKLPESTFLLNNTAWLYATAKDESLRDPTKALTYAKRAVEGDPQPKAAHLDTLAEAYSGISDLTFPFAQNLTPEAFLCQATVPTAPFGWHRGSFWPFRGLVWSVSPRQPASLLTLLPLDDF